ncbi:hypothetical protein SSX86_022889 [Deinandra increscens subsp. villosa]|uniref:RRM domain-containing protein n=1 Tax=Deinandra increscens subsp. villosa TaxID=3103831 RepID=A0AAP0GRS7_9ASTR
MTSEATRVPPDQGGVTAADNDGQWHTVRNRKSQSSDLQARSNMIQNRFIPRFNQNHHDLRSVSTSFYICNFNPSLSTSDLWKRCERWGTVTDVYIAKHLSRAGHRFAFVRFKKVDDIDAMLMNLRSMWFGTYHVFADVARFSNVPVKIHHKMSQTRVLHNKSVYVKKTSVPIIESEPSLATEPLKMNMKQESSLIKKVVIPKDMLNPFSNLKQIVLAKLLDVTSIVRLYSVCRVEGFVGLNIRSQGEELSVNDSSDEEGSENSVENGSERVGDTFQKESVQIDKQKSAMDIGVQPSVSEDPFSAYRIIGELEKQGRPKNLNSEERIANIPLTSVMGDNSSGDMSTSSDPSKPPGFSGIKFQSEDVTVDPEISKHESISKETVHIAYFSLSRSDYKTLVEQVHIAILFSP